MGYSNTSAIMYMNVHMNEYIELFKQEENKEVCQLHLC